VIFDRPSATDLEIRTAIAAAFPSLSDIDIVISSSGGIDYDELPPTDIAVATMWISAYPLARFNKTSAKFYMVQDFEPVFYSAGTLSALCEATYRMGFAGIVNTPGLSEVYHAYGNPSVSFMPAFTELERPSSDPRRTAQVVLYGRPSTDRNAFELIASACHLIKARHGEDVRIVSAGEDWIPEELGLGGIVDNRGRLNSLSDVQDLYRNSDVGICFQLSKHPSYQPFEYLAAGVAPVVNVNRATEWFLADGENCLAVEPFPSEIARVVSDLIEDPELRSRLVANGRKQMREVSWESELSTVWDFICGHE
jgi:glycosyltransferase involved in cell wall biosynthesis